MSHDSPAPHSEQWSIESLSEAETARLGTALGTVAEPGTVVALIGNLGAGKTRFTRAVTAALGVPQWLVNSPTFALIQEYPGRIPVFHFDTYRLRSVDEFLELGAEEYLAGNGICLIEWADRVEEVLPADRLTIRIAIEAPERRIFHFTAGGEHSARLLTELRRQVAASSTDENPAL